jgi:hypothetical protein
LTILAPKHSKTAEAKAAGSLFLIFFVGGAQGLLTMVFDYGRKKIWG